MQNESSNDQIILQTSEGGVYMTQDGDGGGETVLTLDSAVQEAVASGAPIAEEVTEETEEATEDGQQMVAQIVQAEPPTPGGQFKTNILFFTFYLLAQVSGFFFLYILGGPRKVVLLLPDGSLIHTEMDEEQYQALEFEK